MNLAALHHTASGALAYPLDAHHLRVVLKAAVGELDGGVVVWRDRYARDAEPDARRALTCVGSDGVSDYWAATLATPTRRVWYAFCLRFGRRVVWLGETGPAPRRAECAGFQYPYLRSADLFRQPAWLDGLTFYQIFPDRFRNGDPANDPRRGRLRWGDKPRGGSEMAGGDLEGIRLGLPYLEELGIGAFYMTPVFRSSSNHKYNTADYKRVDPTFGTNAELARLVQEAHARGIQIMMDAVFNHSGSDFFAFRDVRRRGADSPYASWFHRIDSFPVDPSLPNYETFATGLGYMPKLNTADPACAEYFLRIGEYWLREAGIDGWRLDVANEVDHAFWRRFRERVKAINPEAWILGEVWHDASPWLQGDQFDSVTHYPWRQAVLDFLSGKRDAREFDQALQRLWYQYPAPVVSGMLHLLGTHDTPRVRTLLGPERARLAAVLLLTGPGVPIVYYGDEIGMEGGPDPDCRRCMPWDPAQWDTVTLDLYRRLIDARRRRPWLNDGAWETLVADPISSAFAYRRTSRRMLGALPVEGPEEGPEESLWVALNSGPAPVEIELPMSSARPARLRDLLSGDTWAAAEALFLVLPPYEAVVLVAEETEQNSALPRSRAGRR